jgi:hypothetical protein
MRLQNANYFPLTNFYVCISIFFVAICQKISKILDIGRFMGEDSSETNGSVPGNTKEPGANV